MRLDLKLICRDGFARNSIEYHSARVLFKPRDFCSRRSGKARWSEMGEDRDISTKHSKDTIKIYLTGQSGLIKS